MSVYMHKGISLPSVYSEIESRLKPHFDEFSRCDSTPELFSHRLYSSVAETVMGVLSTVDADNSLSTGATEKSLYRIVSWNLERGIELGGQLEVFRSDPYLVDADVVLLTETDVGMARSGNEAVAQKLAHELSMNFVFAPCYLNLSKGSGVEYEICGENQLGLHGNAILSRYPLSKARRVPLSNGKDKMQGREKRLGSQAAVVADVELPGLPVTAVAVHLDAQSRQSHRCAQMRDVLDSLSEERFAVIGGDWNTTTHDSSRAFYAIMSYWLRVIMGVDRSVKHYLNPNIWFEKRLFQLLEERGFDYRKCNVLGERTMSYDVNCDKTRKNLGEWLPGWCFSFIHWALRDYEGRLPLKVDWLATRGLQTRDPLIIHDFRENRERPLSDHDAIGVELIV